jgi:putative ABC transport system substrate-binding protein
MDRRRFLIAGAAGVVSDSFRPALAQTKRTIGYLSPRSADVERELLAVLRAGLQTAGFREGANLTIEYRWAEGKYDRLGQLAGDLVARSVALIVTSGGPQPARAARAASRTVPIVFISGSDPALDGLVASLNRPGGRTTGVAVFTTSLGPKRLELLRELLPKSTPLALLVNPTSQIAAMQVEEVQAAARAVGQELHVLNASTETEIDAAFVSIMERKLGGLVMSADLFFQVRREQLVRLAARHRVPTMYEWREFVAAGGLVSYSTVRADAYRHAGIYAGRILSGANPAEMPVVRSTAFEMVVNLKTAKDLGLNISRDFLARADEVLQ